MLYKLEVGNERFEKLEPVPFKDFSAFGQIEKHLEDLIARNILDVLFEEAGLMPIFQERPWQSEADIYALDSAGELTIFELKRGTAGENAVQQGLRYAQEAGQWTYVELDERYRQYANTPSHLQEKHKEEFALLYPLEPKEINRKQHLVITGSAADEPLINAVDYWNRQGVSINFLPYRVYELGGSRYFEFFSLPYDKHKNPADAKGVIFDTNRSWDEDSIWYMMKHSRVAAFGDAKRFVEYVHPGDIVFFSHKWAGLVAAAKVKDGPPHSPDSETLYRDVEFITPVPQRDKEVTAMPFGRVTEITGKSFYWARTIKVPYLTKPEAENLAQKLNEYLESPG